MLILWRRHKTGCTGCRCRKEQKRECHCCRCPIWIDGLDHKIRRSLDTGDWARAERERAKMEAYWQEHGVLAAAAEREPISIEAACGEFLSDERARGLRDSTRYKYELLFKQLKAFARRQGLRFLRELDLPVLRKFRASWPNENFSAQKKLESLRTFFRFAQAGGWITENPAAKLERQKTWRPQVLPFTRVEMIRILAACDAFSVMRVLE